MRWQSHRLSKGDRWRVQEMQSDKNQEIWICLNRESLGCFFEENS